MEKRRVVLIPAYEPGVCLLEALQEMNERGFMAVVVNDGSSREAEEIFREADEYAVVLNHHRNLGKGRALKTGLSYIRDSCPCNYVVVTMDADGQHTAQDAEKICRMAEEQPGHLILGSRKLEKDAPLRSRFGNAVTRMVYRAATGLLIRDTQTGLRAFDSSLVPVFLEIPGERYEYEMNVLLRCSETDIPVVEAETETIYLDKNQSSHFHPFRDSFLIYREIIRFSASSFIGFLVDYSVYSVLLALMPQWAGSVSVVRANVAARIVSATVNFTINRKLVFKSHANLVRSAAEYYLLAACILAGNTLVLSLLISVCSMNQYAAKLCTEAFFFIFSWQIQRRFIFRRGKKVKN